jgi:hypothetical protein
MKPIQILDLTREQPNPPPIIRADGRPKHKIKRGKVVERNARDVDSITLHQTACVFGKRKDQPTRYHRALGVACHALAFHDGVVAFPNPLPWWVYQGNDFNPRALGLEVEGSFPGIPDDPSTPRREDLLSHLGDDSKITPVTDLLVETGRRAILELVQRAALWGATIRYIHAHRQSSSQRRSDPGWELWVRLVLEYAVPVLGLHTEEKLVLGKGDKRGAPIPLEWDPVRGVGRY